MPRRHRGMSGGPSAICDRTGERFAMKDMVREPGTGWLVAKKYSDGRWNLVDHPQNHIPDFAEFDDPKPVKDARPEQSFEQDLILRDEDGNPILDERGRYIYGF